MMQYNKCSPCITSARIICVSNNNYNTVENRIGTRGPYHILGPHLCVGGGGGAEITITMLGGGGDIQ